MRLPWPFGRAQRSPSGDASSDAASEGGSAMPAATSAPVAEARGEWRHLPPLGETLGPPPLVAPNRPFAAGLASNEPPAPILAPLSHGRSLEAPKGLVSGIARPTATVGGPGVPAPVQRSPLGGRRSGGDAAGWDLADAEPTPETALPAAASGSGPAVEPAPIRRLEPVAPMATSLARPALTRAPDPVRAGGPVGLVGQPRAAGATTPITEVPAVQRAPAMAEPAPEPAATKAPSPSPSPAPVAGAPRLTIGQARRLGLGAPVVGGPATNATPLVGGGLTPSAASSHAAIPAAAPATPGIQRAPATEPSELPLATGAAHRDHDHADDGPASSHGSEAPARPTPTAEPVAARPIAAAPQRTAIGATTPIVSAQPLRPRIQRAPTQAIQRAPEAGAPAMAAPTGSTSAATSQGPVKIHRDGRAGELSSALQARSFTHEGEIFLPASHGPLTSGTGRALLAHELTHVTQQRRLGSSLPAEQTPHGRSLEAEAVAAERSPDMTLAIPQAGGPTAPAATPARPQRPVPDGPAPGTQRSPAGGTTTSPTRASGPGAQATSGGRESKHTHSDEELEVLAHQLYHRIGRHLRRELLVDRERVGFALDLP